MYFIFIVTCVRKHSLKIWGLGVLDPRQSKAQLPPPPFSPNEMSGLQRAGKIAKYFVMF